jgi:hypothetical protein
VVINRHRQGLLGQFLADDILVKLLFDFSRGRDALLGGQRPALDVAPENLIGSGNTFITDKNTCCEFLPQKEQI